MKFFQLKELEKEIKADGISEKDGLGYLLCYVLFSASVTGNYTTDPTWRYTLHTLMQLLIAFGGIVWAYRINKRLDNKDFIKRWMALSMVNTIRLVVMLIAVLTPLMVILKIFTTVDTSNLFSSTLPQTLLQVLICLGVIRSFQRISKP